MNEYIENVIVTSVIVGTSILITSTVGFVGLILI